MESKFKKLENIARKNFMRLLDEGIAAETKEEKQKCQSEMLIVVGVCIALTQLAPEGYDLSKVKETLTCAYIESNIYKITV